MTLRSPHVLRTVFTAIVVVGFAASLVGCASVRLTPVAVSDVTSVAGTWTGVVYGSGHQPLAPPARSEPDYVTLTIRENGSYDIVSRQTIGASAGKGQIVISGGRLIMQGEKGRGVATLLSSPSGDHVMDIQATLSDNSILTAQLGPSRP